MTLTACLPSLLSVVLAVAGASQPPGGDRPVQDADVVLDGLSPGTEIVLLVHGMGRTTGSMDRLRRHLAGQGFHAVAWRYRSTRGSVETHGAELAAQLRRLDAEASVGRVHLVGHSLGGIVIRQALVGERPAKLGRVVLIATPNQGSRRARRFAGIARPFMKPITQLTDEEGSFVRSLPPPVSVEVGVIAGSRDSIVRVEETHLEGARDHVIVESGHTRISRRSETLQAVTSFLREGRFGR